MISYFKCNRNIHNWLWAGSEPCVILELLLTFQDLSLIILIKIILIKKACIQYTQLFFLDTPPLLISVLKWCLWYFCSFGSNQYGHGNRADHILGNKIIVEVFAPLYCNQKKKYCLKENTSSWLDLPYLSQTECFIK